MNKKRIINIEGLNEGNINFYTSVVVLNAGGTINMGGISGKSPSNRVEKILKDLKDLLLNKYNIDIISEKVFKRPPDNSNMGEKEWVILFEKIKKIAERKLKIEKLLNEKGIKLEKGGIVVTHGTDTMEITRMKILRERYMILINYRNGLIMKHTLTRKKE